MLYVRPKHSTTNYKALYPFIEAVDNAGGSAHFKADGFMDLVIENLSIKEWFLGEPMDIYSITHYGEQNGDLMADPDMQFGVVSDGEKMRVIPLTFQNDYMGIYQRIFNQTPDGEWMYSKALCTDLDEFLYSWLQNIKEQGFYESIKDIEPQLEYKDTDLSNEIQEAKDLLDGEEEIIF